MSIFTIISAILVALEFFYIMYLETFATASKITARVFNMTQEELEREAVNNLFKKKGVYNGFTSCFYPRFFLDGYLYDLHYLSSGLRSNDKRFENFVQTGRVSYTDLNQFIFLKRVGVFYFSLFFA